MIILGLSLTGCTKISSTDDQAVSKIVRDRIESQVEWHQGSCQNERVQSIVQNIISHELTADMAIQIALLNNPRIQSFFEELGISQANLVEAGLLSNPTFAIEIRYPNTRALHTNIEYLLMTSLLDLFLIPLRTKLAATEFEQTKLRVSHEILNFAFDVRTTYYQLVAERQKIEQIRSIVELASITEEITTKQLAVGNINVLEFQLAKSRFLEAELELLQSRADSIRIREALNRLLGLDADYCLILPESLPEAADEHEVELCKLQTIAIENRLDIKVARLELIRLTQLLGLKEWWSYTNLKGGLAGERDPDGTNLIGPGFSGEIPLFNDGQAARMRLISQIRQSQDRLSELEIRIRSEVREAHKLQVSYLKIIHDYKRSLLPMQRQISESSEELYNVMGLGIDQLLENKRLEVVAYRNYIENMKKYLLAKVELDRALGGYLLLIQRECIQDGWNE